ncbi:proteoglycan 4 isoform X3 [Embiotoca jacksoni]|uniref:proteoglycan 4 isoform X3 n=1 Tax=Embiotoca jacksoni TaxID=100190 RepID=UPI003703792B
MSSAPPLPTSRKRATARLRPAGPAAPKPPATGTAAPRSRQTRIPSRPASPQERRREQQARERGRSDVSPSAQSGLTSLQRKREYWKLMKRQQRARVKARQRDRQGGDGGGGGGSRLSPRSIQGPGSGAIDAARDASPPAALRPKPSATSLSPVSSIPPVLLVSQTTSDAEQSPDALQVQPPVTGGEQSVATTGPSAGMSDSSGAPESPQLSPEWMSQSTDEDSAPSLPTLKPPENPLSSINLQPIEPPGHSPRSVLSPIKIPCAQSQSATLMIPSPTKLAPVSTMVPPKPIPGEPEEDFLRRKREYWRIKKKEQRARKAIRDKGGTPKKTADAWRPVPPVQDIQTPDSDQWMNSSEESEHLISGPVDPVPESFPYISYAVHAEDESQLLFDDYESNAGEEGPVSDAVWRNRYLMDYDPLNQLLVCMVCGDLQYSHVLEGVRAHIEEAHPHTLTLEPEEKQRILVAWDEQVSQRERFFTSQLQQHSGALTEAQRN